MKEMKMKIANAEYIDLTNLNPTATEKEIFNTCNKALSINCAAVCIPTCYVSYMHNTFPKLNICTVVGFPHNNIPFEVLAFQVSKAIIDGANEIDMVMNLSDFKNGTYFSIIEEINAIKRLLGNKILKVIIETCYLNNDEIIKATQIVDESSADYIKTSTGFGTNGATFEDIKTIKNTIKYGTKIKASGGIRTKEEVQKYIDIGCDRIGMSQLPR